MIKAEYDKQRKGTRCEYKYTGDPDTATQELLALMKMLIGDQSPFTGEDIMKCLIHARKTTPKENN